MKELIHLVRGDLDWIVMKCLEKDRTRRYDTANGLAADLKRHLNDEPVIARPPSTAYRFQKLVRRNKFAFAATGAVSVLAGWDPTGQPQCGSDYQALGNEELDRDCDPARSRIRNLVGGVFTGRQTTHFLIQG